MKEKTCHDVLVDFDPLRIQLPGAGPFVGKIRVMLPEHHVKMWDLSMGIDLLEGAHIGGDARLWSVDFMAPEGITAGDLTQFIADTEEQLKELHRLVQEKLDEQFLMERKK